MLFFPVRDARLGARGGGEEEEGVHRFSRVPRVSGRVFSRRSAQKVTGKVVCSRRIELVLSYASTRITIDHEHYAQTTDNGVERRWTRL